MKNLIITAAVVAAGLLVIYQVTRPSEPAPPQTPFVGAPNPYSTCESGLRLKPREMEAGVALTATDPVVTLYMAYPAGAERADLSILIELIGPEIDAFAADPSDLARPTIAIVPAEGRGVLTASAGESQVTTDCHTPNPAYPPVCRALKLDPAGGPPTQALRRALTDGQPVRYRYDPPTVSGEVVLRRADLATAIAAAVQEVETLRRRAAAKGCHPGAISHLGLLRDL